MSGEHTIGPEAAREITDHHIVETEGYHHELTPAETRTIEQNFAYYPAGEVDAYLQGPRAPIDYDTWRSKSLQSGIGFFAPLCALVGKRETPEDIERKLTIIFAISPQSQVSPTVLKALHAAVGSKHENRYVRMAAAKALLDQGQKVEGYDLNAEIARVVSNNYGSSDYIASRVQSRVLSYVGDYNQGAELLKGLNSEKASTRVATARIFAQMTKIPESPDVYTALDRAASDKNIQDNATFYMRLAATEAIWKYDPAASKLKWQSFWTEMKAEVNTGHDNAYGNAGTLLRQIARQDWSVPYLTKELEVEYRLPVNQRHGYEDDILSSLVQAKKPTSELGDIAELVVAYGLRGSKEGEGVIRNRLNMLQSFGVPLKPKDLMTVMNIYLTSTDEGVQKAAHDALIIAPKGKTLFDGTPDKFIPQDPYTLFGLCNQALGGKEALSVLLRAATLVTDAQKNDFRNFGDDKTEVLSESLATQFSRYKNDSESYLKLAEALGQFGPGASSVAVAALKTHCPVELKASIDRIIHTNKLDQ